VRRNLGFDGAVESLGVGLRFAVIAEDNRSRLPTGVCILDEEKRE
jgi:hypothetical protein